MQEKPLNKRCNFKPMSHAWDIADMRIDRIIQDETEQIKAYKKYKPFSATPIKLNGKLSAKKEDSNEAN